MTYTRHGHHIPGTDRNNELGQTKKHRCGGVALCTVCQLDADFEYSDKRIDPPFEDISEYASDPDRFLKMAKLFVVGANNNGADDDETQLSVDDLYIVWFAKTVGNWKALISTSKAGDDLYFEVTYNGVEEETYVDTYLKTSHDVFSQEGQ